MLCEIPFDVSPGFLIAWGCLKAEARIFLDLTLTIRTFIQLNASHTTLRRPIAPQERDGILTICPSCAAVAIHLGPPNPSLITIAKEPLIFRRAGISPALRLLVPTFSLPNAPVWLAPLPSQRMGTLSYHASTKHCKHQYPSTKFQTIFKSQDSKLFGNLEF